jgi:hypothetical protein
MKTANFPRGLPFKPPPAAAASEAVVSAVDSGAAFRAWVVRLAVMTIAAVAAIVLVGVIGIVWALRPAANPESSGWRSVVHEPLPSAPPAGPAVVSAPRLQQADLKARVQPKAAEPLLETVGSLTAANLYQTYLGLGLLADGMEKDIYTATEARKLLATLTALLDSVDAQLAIVGKSSLDAEDRQMVERSGQLAALLRTQAKELRAYWDTPESDLAARTDHEQKFHRARDQAWAGLQELLGITEE